MWQRSGHKCLWHCGSASGENWRGCNGLFSPPLHWPEEHGMRYGGDSGSPSRKSVTGQTALLLVGWVSGGDPCGAGSRRSRSASLQLQIHVPFWGSNLNVQTCYGSIRIRTAPNGAPLTRNLELKLDFSRLWPHPSSVDRQWAI